MVVFGSTRGAPNLTPLAEAPLQRNLASSAATASDRRNYSFRILCRAARARFAPSETGRPPMEHARAGGLDVVVCAANAGRAPPYTVGRGSSSPTPRQVGGCGFEMFWSQRLKSVPLGPCALRPVDNRSTAHGAHAHWRTLVVVCAANVGCAPPYTVGRGSSITTPRQVGGCGFDTPRP